jgi:hypothetical protein
VLKAETTKIPRLRSLKKTLPNGYCENFFRLSFQLFSQILFGDWLRQFSVLNANPAECFAVSPWTGPQPYLSPQLLDTR